MTELQNNSAPRNGSAGTDIDLMGMLTRLWHARSFLLICCAVGAVLGLIVGFSIPKRYAASVVLAPESEQKAGGSVSSIASMMGMNLDNGVDAINVNMFPEVVHSTPFVFRLFDLPVETADGRLRTTLLDYMLHHQKKAWWVYLAEAPFKALKWGVSLISGKEEERNEGVLQMYNLPKKEREVIKYFANNLKVNIDKKTEKTEMSLEMQDPLVVATVMNAVVENLKEYMSDYRTSKARQDAENLSVICAERKADYYKAQQQYAAYADANKSVVRQSAQAEQERLQQEMQLAYQVYSQVATQLEAARIKEQQAKPVFTIIDPVTVPLRQAAPSKAKLLIGFVMLFGCVGSAWVLVGRDACKRLRSAR